MPGFPCTHCGRVFASQGKRFIHIHCRHPEHLICDGCGDFKRSHRHTCGSRKVLRKQSEETTLNAANVLVQMRQTPSPRKSTNASDGYDSDETVAMDDLTSPEEYIERAAKHIEEASQIVDMLMACLKNSN